MGLPVTLADLRRRDVLGGEHGAVALPAADPGPDRGAGAPRARRGQGALPAEARRRRLDRHDEPDRAAGRLGRRRGPQPAPSRWATAATRSPGRRSSSPGATTTSPRTSATWCWRGCRTAAPGTRGISLFLVPKFLPDADGRPGVRERGARAVARAQDGAARQPDLRDGVRRAPRGWLIGAPHQGMAAMFTMMNNARLGVGVQGLAPGRRGAAGGARPSRASAGRGGRRSRRCRRSSAMPTCGGC